jgi:Flp pilus assembly pilin Flp
MRLAWPLRTTSAQVGGIFQVTSLAIRIHSFLSGAFRNLKDEHGQDLVEYAVLVGFIGIAAGLALLAFMPGPLATFKNEIGDCLQFKNTCG